MAIAACEDRHFGRQKLRADGYVEYIPASHMPTTVRCGTPGCWNTAAIALKQGERGVVLLYGNVFGRSLTMDISEYHQFIRPL